GFSGSGTMPPFGVNPGTCTAGMTGSCKFTAAFSPTALGPKVAFLSVTECLIEGGCSGEGFAYSATGGAASVKPATVDFGNVALGTSKAKSVKVTPDPGYHFISFIGAINSPPYVFNLGTCINAQATTCKFTETFSPTALGPSLSSVEANE